MKKIFFFIILFGIFIFCFQTDVMALEIPDGYDISVCSKSFGDCTYQDLDTAFTAIQSIEYDTLDHVDIYLSPEKHSISKDYTFRFYVSFNAFSWDHLSIDGGGHTINSSYRIYFCGDQVSISNLNFRYNYVDDVREEFIIFKVLNLSFQNSSVVNLSPLRKGNYVDGIYFDDYNVIDDGYSLGVGSVVFDHVTVSNFSTSIYNEKKFFYTSIKGRYESIADSFIPNGMEESIRNDGIIYPYISYLDISRNIQIKNSDLSNNIQSLSGAWKGTISNTKLSSISLFDACSCDDRSESERQKILMIDGESIPDDSGDVCTPTPLHTSKLVLEEDNDYGEGKISLFQYDYDTFSERDESLIYDNSLAHKYLYLIKDDTSVIDVRAKKEKTMDPEKLKEVELLDYFVDLDEVSIQSYDFTVSDSSIAKVDSGKVYFLKKGNVTVTATNPVTKETYTVIFRMTENPKTFNSFLFFSIIFMMISFLTFLICIPKKRSIY